MKGDWKSPLLVREMKTPWPVRAQGVFLLGAFALLSVGGWREGLLVAGAFVVAMVAAMPDVGVVMTMLAAKTDLHAVMIVIMMAVATSAEVAVVVVAAAVAVLMVAAAVMVVLVTGLRRGGGKGEGGHGGKAEHGEANEGEFWKFHGGFCFLRFEFV